MARPSAPLSQQSLAEVLDQVADRTPGPVVDGRRVTVAFAAALVEMTSKFDDSILAQARAMRANALRTRMLEIADVERDIYGPVLEAEAMDPAIPSVSTGSRRRWPRPPRRRWRRRARARRSRSWPPNRRRRATRR